MNKRKILESAQKHLQKGALDKALDDYLTLVKADPKDSNIRLKVGDLHLKLGRTQDAIDGYLRVAQQFMSEGFDAKAVALYKQISKLDDKRFEVHAQLGDLYQRMGLTSEAMKALQLAADGAFRSGDKPHALELLRRMAALDPSNTTNRLKVADLLRTEGRAEDALSEYDEVVRELERQGNAEQQVKVLERALEVAPERLETLRALARVNLANGAPARAAAPARKLVAAAPDDLEAAELLGRALEGAGLAEEAADVFRALAERFRVRGDEDRARALIQRYGAADAFSVDDSEPPVLESDGSGELELDPELDASLGLEGFEALPETTALETFPDDSSTSAVAADDAPSGAELDPDADVEQLLAEASVFSRYSKHDRAIETLRAALRVEPGNPHALEKLGDALLAVGNRAHAASALQRAGAAFVNAGDAVGVARVRELLRPLDAKAAAALAVPEPAPSSEDADAFDGEIDIEIDPGLEPSDAAPAAERPLGDADDFSGIEIDTGEISPGEDAVFEAGAGSSDAEPLSLEDSREFSLDGASHSKPQASTQAEQTSVSSATVEADFEEAEFYREQGLADEARVLYERVLAAVPNHPRAQLRIGELSAAQVKAPVVTKPAPRAAEKPSFDLDLEIEPDLAAEPAPVAVGDEPDDTAPQLEVVQPQAAPLAAPIAPSAKAPRVADETEPVPLAEDDPAGAFGGADFDLAAELTGALGSANAQDAGSEGEGFQEVFAAFKAGVKREVGDGDFEAHYDLGNAYKDMGLFEDALGEFRIALADPGRKIACLHLMGVCTLELGRAPDAIAHLSQALAGGSLPAQQEAALRMDLGRAYQAAGDIPRAKAAVEAALAADPSFEGVERLLAELERAPAEVAAPVAVSEGLESFDDLIDESGASEAGPQPVRAPVYESFDDLMTDRELEPAAALAPEPVAESTPEPPAAEPEEPAAPPITAPRPAVEATPSPAPTRRKKKISFV